MANVVVPANTVVSVNVPTPSKNAVAVINATNNYYVSDQVITLPSSGTFQFIPGELNKPTVALKRTKAAQDVTTLYFICPEETRICVSFFDRAIVQAL